VRPHGALSPVNRLHVVENHRSFTADSPQF
jgi:hypothetical protein